MSDSRNDQCRAAISSGDIDLLKLLKIGGYVYTERHFKAACSGHHISVLEYLKSIDCPYTGKCYLAAAKCGYVTVLLWLEHNNYSYNVEDLEAFLLRFENSNPYSGEYEVVCSCIRYILGTRK